MCRSTALTTCSHAPEYRLLDNLYSALAHAARALDLLIVLHAETSELERRVRARANSLDRDLDSAILAELQARYLSWVDQWRGSPVLFVDTHARDIRTAADRDWVIDEVRHILGAGVARPSANENV